MFSIFLQGIQPACNSRTIWLCQYENMPGNVLNAKPVRYVVLAKMMTNYYFVTIVIEGKFSYEFFFLIYAWFVNLVGYSHKCWTKNIQKISFAI